MCSAQFNHNTVAAHHNRELSSLQTLNARRRETVDLFNVKAHISNLEQLSSENESVLDMCTHLIHKQLFVNLFCTCFWYAPLSPV